MVGKWVWRVERGAGEGWWKKVVGPNHSLFFFYVSQVFVGGIGG